MTILLCGLLSDPVLRYACAGLLAEEADFVFLDVRQYPEVLSFDLLINEEGCLEGNLRYGSQIIDLTSIVGAYSRLPGTDARTHRPGSDEPDAIGIRAEADAALNVLLEMLPCPVVNRPSAQGSNGAKPFQQQLIRAHGFATPRTLVTNDPSAVTHFYEACTGQVVYKSISGIRSIVCRLGAEQMVRLESLRTCPVQFQEYIAGVDIRVHTVGEEVFATRVLSDADDYRYASRQGATVQLEATTLPSELESRCLALAADLNLLFAGIDLRCDHRGEYYCFEVNPSPAFHYYEHQTGQPICSALIRLLSQGARARLLPSRSHPPAGSGDCSGVVF